MHMVGARGTAARPFGAAPTCGSHEAIGLLVFDIFVGPFLVASEWHVPHPLHLVSDHGAPK